MEKFWKGEIFVQNHRGLALCNLLWHKRQSVIRFVNSCALLWSEKE